MRLEIESIDIKETQEGSKTHAEKGVLSVDLRELERVILEDPRIKSVEIALVKPGENVRMLNILDVVQPRCKIDPVGADFPGFVGKMEIAGKGEDQVAARGCGDRLQPELEPQGDRAPRHGRSGGGAKPLREDEERIHRAHAGGRDR